MRRWYRSTLVQRGVQRVLPQRHYGSGTLRNNRVVVALGGNALQRRGQKGTVECIASNAKHACREIANLIRDGFRVVVTHGNGPQVGQLLQNTEMAHLGKGAPLYPLDVCVAQSQGFLGFLLAQSLDKELAQTDHHFGQLGPLTVPIVSQVVVDGSDPGFLNPSKPVGSFYSKVEAAALQKNGLTLKEDAGRGWRQVVPSPMPREIVEKEAIRSLFEQSSRDRSNLQRFTVIAAGGGGIPVVVHEDGSLKGVPAVIDKDHTAVLLAEATGSDTLLILTDVDFVYSDFNTPNQKELRNLSVEDAQQLLDTHHFGAGSMEPKIHASLQFLRGECADETPSHDVLQRRRVVISSLSHGVEALRSTIGTQISWL